MGLASNGHTRTASVAAIAVRPKGNQNETIKILFEDAQQKNCYNLSLSFNWMVSISISSGRTVRLFARSPPYYWIVDAHVNRFVGIDIDVVACWIIYERVTIQMDTINARNTRFFLLSSLDTLATAIGDTQAKPFWPLCCKCRVCTHTHTPMPSSIFTKI